MEKLALLVSVLVWANVVWSLNEAPSPGVECTNSLVSLINCEAYLSGTNVTPTETCCAGLGSLMASAPSCLCGVLAGNPAFPSINLTRATQLPDQCDIPVDQSQCDAITSPAPGAPAQSSTPGTPPAPGGSDASMDFLPSATRCWAWVVVGSIPIITSTVLRFH